MDFSGTSEATPEAAHELGSQVAAKALNQGVRRLLESLA
jgi:hypothetical protein